MVRCFIATKVRSVKNNHQPGDDNMTNHLKLVGSGFICILLSGCLVLPAVGPHRYTGTSNKRRVVKHRNSVSVIRRPPPARPARRRVTRSKRPGTQHVWVEGHWEWRNGDYVWVSGRWERPQRGRSAWVPGRWEQRGNGWVRRPGYWK